MAFGDCRNEDIVIRGAIGTSSLVAPRFSGVRSDRSDLCDFGSSVRFSVQYCAEPEEGGERRPSPLLVVRVIRGDGARTGDFEESNVGDGDLGSLGFDLERNDREDSRSAGNGGVIFSSVIV